MIQLFTSTKVLAVNVAVCIPILVRKPAVCTCGRAWVCGNVRYSVGTVWYGYNEAQQGVCGLVCVFLVVCVSLNLQLFMLTSLECTFVCHTCEKAQSQTLFDASCSPPSLLPEGGHAPALSCQERPVGSRPTAAADPWYSGWSQYGRQSVQTSSLWFVTVCAQWLIHCWMYRTCSGYHYITRQTVFWPEVQLGRVNYSNIYLMFCFCHGTFLYSFGCDRTVRRLCTRLQTKVRKDVSGPCWRQAVTPTSSQRYDRGTIMTLTSKSRTCCCPVVINALLQYFNVFNPSGSWYYSSS